MRGLLQTRSAKASIPPSHAPRPISTGPAPDDTQLSRRPQPPADLLALQRLISQRSRPEAAAGSVQHAPAKPAKEKPQTFDLFGKTFQVNKAADGTLTIAPQRGSGDGWSFTQAAIAGTFRATRSEPQLKYIHASGSEEAMTEQVQIQVPETGVPIVGVVQAVLGEPAMLQIPLTRNTRGLKAANTSPVVIFSASVKRLDYAADAAFQPVAGDTITLGGLGEAFVYSGLQGAEQDDKPTTETGFFHLGEYTRFKTSRGVSNVSDFSDSGKAAVFDRLVSAGTVTANEAAVFKSVTIIEAPLSGVQNYDSGILSFGFAQWTIHSDLPKVLKRVPTEVFEQYVGRYGLTVGTPQLGTEGFTGKFVASASARANYGIRNRLEGSVFLDGKEVVANALYQAAGTLAAKYGELVAQVQAAQGDIGSADKQKDKAAKTTITAVATALKGLPGVKASDEPAKLAELLIAAGTAAQAAAQQLSANSVSDEALRANEWVLRFELLGQDPGAQAAQIQEAKATLATLLATSWSGQKNSLLLRSRRAHAALLSTYFNNPSSASGGMTRAVGQFKEEQKSAAKASAEAAVAAKKPVPAPLVADWDAFPWAAEDSRWGLYYDAAAQRLLEDHAIQAMTSGTNDPERRRGILGTIPD